MKKFMEIMGKGSGIDFSFISKESMKNQSAPTCTQALENT